MSDTDYRRSRPHPWHGLSPGPNPPEEIDAFIEMTPFDVVKYEVDKITGYLRIDRPQRTSSTPPALYGFIPRTWCGPKVAALSPTSNKADEDPLDVCVLSERPVNRAEVVLRARVIGGIRMIDAGEADDKIIAVLHRDPIWADARELGDVPRALVDRLTHYFSTYKLVPDRPHDVTIAGAYGREHALEVVQAAIDDYATEFG